MICKGPKKGGGGQTGCVERPLWWRGRVRRVPLVARGASVVEAMGEAAVATWCGCRREGKEGEARVSPRVLSPVVKVLFIFSVKEWSFPCVVPQRRVARCSVPRGLCAAQATASIAQRGHGGYARCQRCDGHPRRQLGVGVARRQKEEGAAAAAAAEVEPPHRAPAWPPLVSRCHAPPWSLGGGQQRRQRRRRR